MATVRFSEILRSEIITAASYSFNQKLTAMKQEFPSPYDGDKFYEKAYGRYAERMKQFPIGFFSMEAQIVISGIKLPGDTARLMLPSGGTRFPFTGHKLMPDKHHAVPKMEATSSYNNVLTYVASPDDEEDMEYYNAARDWHERHQKLVVERDTFVDGVKKVINAFTTLSPALKAWPPLWDLLPHSVQEKHKEVVDRKRNRSEDLDVDLDQLTGVVVRNKILR